MSHQKRNPRLRNKVLVIEDALELRDLLSFTLKRAGFSVGTVENGIERLKKAKSLLPDLILLDLALPELDGFSVCETLRRDPDHAGVPILVLTAFAGELARALSLASGATEYVSKPFSLGYFMEKVRSLVGASASTGGGGKRVGVSRRSYPVLGTTGLRGGKPLNTNQH